MPGRRDAGHQGGQLGLRSSEVVIFILAAGDYVTPLLLGGPAGSMLGQFIALEFSTRFNWPAGAAMSFGLLGACGLILGAVWIACAAQGASRPAPSEPVPYWAFPAAREGPAPVRPPPPPGETPVKAPPNTAAVDVYPDEHPLMPPAVRGGGEALGCGLCHLPAGGGRSENMSLTGLPYAYLKQQWRDMKRGVRGFQPDYAPDTGMSKVVGQVRRPLGEGRQADDGDLLRRVFLAEIRQDEQRPSQPLFARIEELIDQVRLDPAVARQKMRREQLAKRGLVMEDFDHLGLAHPHDLAFDHCPGRRQPQRLPDQAALAEELFRTSNDRWVGRANRPS